MTTSDIYPLSPALRKMLAPVDVLDKRDAHIHEAAHAEIARSYGAGVRKVWVESDPTKPLTGFVDVEGIPFDVAVSERKKYRPRERVVFLAKREAIISLAGYAAECRISKTPWASKRIVGAYTGDIDNAIEFLRAFDCEDELWNCWQETRARVDEYWQKIWNFAEQLKNEYQHEWQP